LVDWLIAPGYDAVHVSAIGLSAADDQAVWHAAIARGLTIMSKDEDYVSIALSRQTGACVVWLRIGNATNPALFAWLGLRLQPIVDALARGEKIIEVR
jgi:predicted nuclease of predicted toxin-antitoxin system